MISNNGLLNGTQICTLTFGPNVGSVAIKIKSFLMHIEQQ